MDFHCKISLIGNEFTGKTSLIQRYIEGTFVPGYKATFGAEFIDKTFSAKELPELTASDNFTATIWDMAGQAHFQSMAQLYMEGSLGIVLVFDVNNQESFQALERWLEIRERVCPESVLQIVGNKSDLECVISKNEIKQVETKYHTKFLLTSAKENKQVDEMFATIAGKLINRYLGKE